MRMEEKQNSPVRTFLDTQDDPIHTFSIQEVPGALTSLEPSSMFDNDSIPHSLFDTQDSFLMKLKILRQWK